MSGPCRARRAYTLPMPISLPPSPTPIVTGRSTPTGRPAPRAPPADRPTRARRPGPLDRHEVRGPRPDQQGGGVAVLGGNLDRGRLLERVEDRLERLGDRLIR